MIVGFVKRTRAGIFRISQTSVWGDAWWRTDTSDEVAHLGRRVAMAPILGFMSDRERQHHIVDAMPIERVTALLTLLDEEHKQDLASRLASVPEETISSAEAREIADALAEAASDPGITLKDFERELVG